MKAHAPRRASSRKPQAAKVAVRALANGKKAPKAAKKVARQQPTVATPQAKRAASKPAKAKPTTTVSKPVAVASAKAASPSAKVTAAAAKAASPSAKVTAAAAKAAAAASAQAISAAAAKKPARKSIKEAAGVSTDAVARRTGKSWDDWFEVLDSAGAANLDQRGVIAILAQKHGIGPWWQQMIAVGYESVRGKSDKPAVPDGFRINSSCTLDAPLPRVFRLWSDAGERARWLADDRFVMRGATADKTIRARWGKGTSQVAVSFSEKSGRTEVNVEHHQIESSAAAEQMKAYWTKKLGLLGALAPRR